MLLRRIAPAVLATAALVAVAPSAALANTTATGYAGPGGTQQHHVTKPKVLGVTNSGGPNCSNSNSSGTSGSNCSGTAPTCASGGSGSSGSSNSSAACAEHTSSGSLPFTGFDLLLVVATGIGLLGAGFGLRRMTRRESVA